MKRIALLAVFAALLGLGSAAFAAEPCGCKAQPAAHGIGLSEIETTH